MEPGYYSLFVLIDDGTWVQPTFKTEISLTEEEFRARAEAVCGGFISYGLQSEPEPVDVHDIVFD